MSEHPIFFGQDPSDPLTADAAALRAAEGVKWTQIGEITSIDTSERETMFVTGTGTLPAQFTLGRVAPGHDYPAGASVAVAVTTALEMSIEPEEMPDAPPTRGERNHYLYPPAQPLPPVIDKALTQHDIPMGHDLYTDADVDRPDEICDRTGRVVLGLCKRCGKAEAELVDLCVPTRGPFADLARGEEGLAPAPAPVEEFAKPRGVPEILSSGIATFTERNALYGDNYRQFGPIMTAIFPEGVRLETAADFSRFGVFTQAVAKFTRYAASFSKGGHPDSAHDLMVYGAMLVHLDEVTRDE